MPSVTDSWAIEINFSQVLALTSMFAHWYEERNVVLSTLKMLGHHFYVSASKFPTSQEPRREEVGKSWDQTQVRMMFLNIIILERSSSWPGSLNEFHSRSILFDKLDTQSTFGWFAICGRKVLLTFPNFSCTTSSNTYMLSILPSC